MTMLGTPRRLEVAFVLMSTALVTSCAAFNAGEGPRVSVKEFPVASVPAAAFWLPYRGHSYIPVPVTAPRDRRLARENPVSPEISSPTREQNPSDAAKDLIGLKSESVTERIGYPDDVEKNAMSLVWVFDRPPCKLRLFFYPEIRTSAFHVLKYTLTDLTGERLNDETACMQQFTESKYGIRNATRIASQTGFGH